MSSDDQGRMGGCGSGLGSIPSELANEVKHGDRDLSFTYSLREGEMRREARRTIRIIRLAMVILTGRRLRQIFRHAPLLGLRQNGFNGLDQLAGRVDA